MLATQKMIRFKSAFYSLPSMRFACESDPEAKTLTLQTMEEKLRVAFHPTTMVQVVDPYGDMTSVQIKVVSEKFKGMMPLARHRAINDVLKDEIKLIHAV